MCLKGTNSVHHLLQPGNVISHISLDVAIVCIPTLVQKGSLSIIRYQLAEHIFSEHERNRSSSFCFYTRG